MKRAALFLTAAASLSAAPLQAATYQHPQAGIRLDAPDTWSSDVRQDVLQLRAPSEGAAVLLVVLDELELDDVQRDLDRHMARVITDPRVMEAPQHLERHGLRGLTARASGAFQGTPIQLRTLALELPPRRVLLVVAFLQEDAPAATAQQLSDILQSIQKK
jgi:hypothetical protein